MVHEAHNCTACLSTIITMKVSKNGADSIGVTNGLMDSCEIRDEGSWHGGSVGVN